MVSGAGEKKNATALARDESLTFSKQKKKRALSGLYVYENDRTRAIFGVISRLQQERKGDSSVLKRKRAVGSPTELKLF